MAQRKVRLALGGLVAVAAAAGLWLVWGPGERAAPHAAEDPQREGPSGAATAHSPGARADRAALRRLAGRYAVKSSTQVQVQAQGKEKDLGTTRAEGELQLAELSSDATGTWMAARAREVKLEASEIALQINDLGGDRSPLAADAEFAVRLDADGRVSEVRFDPALPVGLQALWSGAMRDGQFVLPAEADGRAWQAQERNQNGEFRAHYQQQASGSYHKRWATAADPSAPVSQQDSPAELLFISEGQGDFRFDGGQLARLSMELTLRGRGLGQVPMPQARGRLELQRLGQVDGRWASRLVPARLVAWDGQVKPRKQVADRPVNLGDFEAQVAAASGATKLQARADQRHLLTAALRRDPALVQAAGQRLASGQLAEPVERTYIEALVMADTPEAQQQLATLAGDRKTDERLAMQLLAGAIFAAHPSAEYLALLETLSRDRERPVRANGSLLVLGAAVRATAKYDEAAAAEQNQKLLRRATPRIASGQPGVFASQASVEVEVANARERAAWLDALGNAGQAESVPVIVQALSDPEDNVRKAAAHALRFMPAGKVKSAMIKAMKQEESIFVREALLLAARYQGPGAQLEFANKALRFDESAYVRLAAAYTVATWAMETPALYPLLQQALDSEKSEKVRESLKNYLQPGRVAPPFALAGQPAGGQP